MSSLDFYRARAAQAREEADAATLVHVRERCRRSEEAWEHLADRAERQIALRAEQDEYKAKQLAERNDDEHNSEDTSRPALFAGQDHTS